MTTVFLSHKTEHAPAAQALAAALGIVVPRDEIFLAEEIRKGDDWRANVDQALAEAKCFVLLYTDVRLDWSWCFFEVELFDALPPGKPRRPIYCLHPPDVPPPSPRRTRAERSADCKCSSHRRSCPPSPTTRARCNGFPMEYGWPCARDSKSWSRTAAGCQRCTARRSSACFRETPSREATPSGAASFRPSTRSGRRPWHRACDPAALLHGCSTTKTSVNTRHSANTEWTPGRD